MFVLWRDLNIKFVLMKANQMHTFRHQKHFGMTKERRFVWANLPTSVAQQDHLN